VWPCLRPACALRGPHPLVRQNDSLLFTDARFVLHQRLRCAAAIRLRPAADLLCQMSRLDVLPSFLLSGPAVLCLLFTGGPSAVIEVVPFVVVLPV
jgi:hypothetical protein